MIKLKNDMTADGPREIEKTAKLKKILRAHGITLSDFSDYAYIGIDVDTGADIQLCMGKYRGEYDYVICNLDELEN